ncbi:MAG: SCO family protein [Deltaproteobacteria bacterium]|nr:MAG: SCO family protein [Deltaproteobacteria bacterium]
MEEKAATQEQAQEQGPSFERQLLSHPLVWVAIAAFLVLPFLLRGYLRRIPAPPPVLGALPAFELTNQDGKPFGLEQLKGQVTVVGFFFSRCKSICPPLMQAMRRLQDRYKRHNVNVRLLSITVDPGYDTPKRLQAYAKTLGADLKRWTFLTGPIEKIKALALKGFHVAVGDPVKKANFFDITHTSKLILVDQKGRIRGRPDNQGNPVGYFSSTKDGLDEVYHRSMHTLWERFAKKKSS